MLASNPCPCGRRGGSQPCECTDHAVAAYQRKLSGPVLDRIDLHVPLRPIPPDELLEGPPGEPSAAVRERVVAARERQRARGQDVPNGRLPPGCLDELIRIRPEARRLLRDGVARHGLTGRAAHRLPKVARTLADLDAEDVVGSVHVAEALCFRPVDGWT